MLRDITPAAPICGRQEAEKTGSNDVRTVSNNGMLAYVVLTVLLKATSTYSWVGLLVDRPPSRLWTTVRFCLGLFRVRIILMCVKGDKVKSEMWK